MNRLEREFQRDLQELLRSYGGIIPPIEDSVALLRRYARRYRCPDCTGGMDIDKAHNLVVTHDSMCPKDRNRKGEQR
ncbi:hypothetical protein [Rhodococcus indonesiensis]|uniref:hypothetical protein n=1 Tax=Rhodococcus indonesiensis TaxID=3055869 RepID=UPI0039F68B6E